MMEWVEDMAVTDRACVCVMKEENKCQASGGLEWRLFNHHNSYDCCYCCRY